MAPRPRQTEVSAPPVGAPLQLNRASSGRNAPSAPGTFEGRVVSSETGRGVPSAEITFEHQSGAISVRTRGDGFFAFQPPQPGDYRLAAILARDYLPFAPEWGRSPVRLTARAGEQIRDIVLVLTPAVEYFGIVFDPRGAPLPEARISLLDASQGEMALSPLQDTFVSDGRGEFRFRSPAWAWLEAKHASFAPAKAQVDASAQVSRRFALRMGEKEDGETEASERLVGQVLDPKGSPVAGAAVQARRRGRGWSSFSAKSDPDGRFTIEGLPEGRYDLVATSPGYAAGRAEAVPAGTTSIVLQLSAGAHLRGTVRDHSSAPVVAFNITILRTAGALERNLLRSDAFMDAQGRYDVSGLPPGAYVAVAAGYGYAPSREAPFTVSESLDDKGIDFALERGGELHGTVVDSKTGAPLRGAHLDREGQLSAGSGIPLLTSAITDDDGAFELRGLTAGLGSVLVRADGHHSRIVAGLRFENGRRLGPLRIDLNPTAEREVPRVELEGIGATLQVLRDSIRVVDLMPRGGATEAGLKVGDEILTVDGQAVTDLGFQGAIQRIRGPEGSCIPIVVRRSADHQVGEVVVCRRRFSG